MSDAPAETPEKQFWWVIGLVSFLAVALLFWLIYFQPASTVKYAWVGYLPQLNAGLNFTSLCLALCGLWAISKKRFRLHGGFMIGAGVASLLFLVSYVIYHYLGEHTKFSGEGAIRYVYYAILISHIILSVVVVPLLLATFSLAIMRQFERHRKVAKWTYPVWLYVSVTGVLVFVFLRGFG